MSAAPWPYADPVDDGGAAHLVEGLRLPEVSLPSTSGGEITIARLAGASVLFVYPWTGTPGLPNPLNWDDIPGAHGSTPEAEGFRDHYDAFHTMGFDVLGLSGQTTEHQRDFAARIGLTFSLLSDAEGKFASSLRLPSFETGGVTYLKRLTLVVRDGKIARTFYPVPSPPTHASQVLASLRASV